MTESSCRIHALKFNDKNLANSVTLNIKHPLVVNPLQHNQFIYPDENNDIKLNTFDEVFFSCGHNGNNFEVIPNVSSKKFVCLCNQYFAADENIYEFKNLKCEHFIKSDIVNRGIVYGSYITEYNEEHNILMSDFHNYEIGFYTDDNRIFLKLIDVVYRDETGTTMFVVSKISKFINQVSQVRK